MEVNIKVIVPDNFKPRSKTCYKICPFSELDSETGDLYCPQEIPRAKSCIMKEAMKGIKND